jgi:serine protease Do
MKTLKLLPLAVAATVLAFSPLVVSAADGAKSNLELARQLNQAFVQVAEQVTPSVVVINVVQKVRASRFNPLEGGDGAPMDELRKFLRQMPQQQMPEHAAGEGSGIIIRDDGYILTNCHVVEDAEKIEVRLKDGRIFKATVRGSDTPSDVAVIKIEATHLPAAKLADSSKTRVGEFAIAIGAPFALDYSVTFGHVSAKDRSNIPTDEMEGPTMIDQSFIQTDANINPGNSGGPLINIDGEVIGVNTLIRGLHTGIGFAIPSNLAREVSDKLISDGKFTRSWLGVVITSMRESAEFRDLLTGVKDGVIIKEILTDGPAARSELQPADVVTAVDGKPVVTSQQLKEEVRAKKPGQEVSLSIYRTGKDGDKNMKITVRPQEWTDRSATNAAPADDNSTPSDESADNIGLRVDMQRRRGRGPQGVVVIKVDPDSPAGRTNLREGDTITAVGNQPVTNPKQFYDAIKAADLKKGVIIKSASRGSSKVDLLKLGGD